MKLVYSLAANNRVSLKKKTILNSNYFQKKDQAIREEWMFELFKKGVALLNGIKRIFKTVHKHLISTLYFINKQ